MERYKIIHVIDDKHAVIDTINSVWEDIFNGNIEDCKEFVKQQKNKYV